jgi:hypothetical protein
MWLSQTLRRRLTPRRVTLWEALLETALLAVALVLLLGTGGTWRDAGLTALIAVVIAAISSGLRLWTRRIGLPPSRVDEAYLSTLRRWLRAQRGPRTATDS